MRLFVATAVLMIVAVSLCAPAGAQDLPVYAWNEAHSHMGETCVVEGTVKITKNIGNICFLNFDPDFKTYISIVIHKELFDGFPAAPEVHFRGARVRVTGTVTEHKGRPQIVLESADRIEKLDGPGEAVEAKAEPQAAVSAAEDGVPVISWDYADEHMNEKVVVTGRIARTHNTGSVCFLNFHNNYRKYLTAVVFKRTFGQFPEPPEEYFLNRFVRITGTIQDHDGSPEIVIEDASQIEIVEPGAADRSASGEQDEGDAAVLIRALVGLLMEKGVFTREEWQGALEAAEAQE